MRPVDFKGSNAVFAKEQPGVIPLAAYVTPDSNSTITKWKLSFPERIRLLFSGTIWVVTKVYGKPLQPLRLTAKNLMTCDVNNPW